MLNINKAKGRMRGEKYEKRTNSILLKGAGNVRSKEWRGEGRDIAARCTVKGKKDPEGGGEKTGCIR